MCHLYILAAPLKHILACLKMSCECDAMGSLVLGGILQQSNSDLAVSHYRKYYHANPSSPMLWNNLGVLCAQKGKKLASISCLRRSAYLDPLSWVSFSKTLNMAPKSILNMTAKISNCREDRV